MMMRSISCFAALSLVACAAGEDEDWMPEVNTTDGKADAVATIMGNAIPSAFVNPTKKYLVDREINSLVDVAALNALQQGLAQRVDGIVANLPEDGSLHVAELVKIEQPPLVNSLFPEEKAALPRLWELLEAPTTGASVSGVAAGAFAATDLSTPPGALVVPSFLTIASLPADVQALARRVQLLFNSDTDPQTVTIADLDHAVALQQPFTPAELAQLADIKRLFMTRATSAARAVVEVAAPGSTTTTGSIGVATFTIVQDIRHTDERSYNANGWQVSLRAQRSLGTTLALPANSQLLLIEHTTGTENVLAAGSITVPVAAGTYVFEVWTGGQRVLSKTAVLPDLGSRTDDLDLTPFFDYEFRAGGVTLARNFRSATIDNSVPAMAYTSHTLDLAANPPPSSAYANILGRTASPSVTLPTGRYTRTAGALGPVAVEVYPNNVIKFKHASVTDRGKPSLIQTFRGPTKMFSVQRWAAPTGVQITFDPASNNLTVTKFTHSSQTSMLDETLTAAMRDP